MCRSAIHIGTARVQSRDRGQTRLRPVSDRSDTCQTGLTRLRDRSDTCQTGWTGFGSLESETLTWIFDQRSRLREAAARGRRSRIDRQRLAEVPDGRLRIAGLETEHAEVDVSGRVPGARVNRRRERRPGAFAPTES